MSARADNPWENMTHEEKQAWLFKEQKETLNRFLKHGTISKVQYDQRLRSLIEKMNYEEQLE